MKNKTTSFFAFFGCLTVMALFISCNSKNEKNQKSSDDSDSLNFKYPPEWEPQEAIWVDFATDFSFGSPNESKLKIIKTLSNYINTKVVFDDDSLKQVAIDYLKENNGNLDSITFIKTLYPMNWIRDPGPIFLSNGSELRMADFKWSCYGNVYNYDCDTDLRGNVDNEIAKEMGLEIDSTGIYLEGGGIEVSNNTAIAYKAMATQRNPDKSIGEVEKIILTTYDKEQMIWLDDFPLIDKPNNKIANFLGNGANGHIDVTTRFLNDSTILATVISENDKNKNELLLEDYRILNENLKQLKLAKRPNGKDYNILTIEAPDYSLYQYPTKLSAETKENFGLDNFQVNDSVIFVPALEYANFLITNGAILVSKYWREGMPESEKQKDKNIQIILKEHFPNRDILALDVLPINWGGGGIHCRTQQEPKIK